MMKKKKLPILSLIILLGSLLISHGYSAHAYQQPEKGAKECHLKIDGMNCPICAARIKKGLKGLVISSDIDVEKGTGRFVYAEGTESCKTLAEKITNLGFEATAQKSD